jgi:N-acetylglucosaminyldiphosphoundecaprenol N-acetyl-beta-D-mannosaminyltransferase
MSDLKFIDWKSYKIFTDDLNKISYDGKLSINTINQYSYCVAEKDRDFKNALINSDILLPDGIGIVIAVKMMLGKKISKIAGADLHAHLLQDCYKNKRSVFYLGSSDGTLDRIKERLQIEYPGLKIGSYSPPYKQSFDDNDNQKMLSAVNLFKPDVLFIGMTAPKQEKWAALFKSQIDAHVICTIGAVFDFYAETVKRPHKFWIYLGLEWFVRLLKEPGRMWKRYIYYGPVFILNLSGFTGK